MKNNNLKVHFWKGKPFFLRLLNFVPTPGCLLSLTRMSQFHSARAKRLTKIWERLENMAMNETFMRTNSGLLWVSHGIQAH